MPNVAGSVIQMSRCHSKITSFLLSSFFPVQPASLLLHADCLRHSYLFLANFMHRLPFLHTSLFLCPNLSMILALLLILACLMLHFLQYTNASGAILPPKQVFLADHFLSVLIPGIHLYLPLTLASLLLCIIRNSA